MSAVLSNDSTWMNNPNIRLALAVLISGLPVLIGDLAISKVSLLTAAVMLANMLVAAKAFMSDPNQAANPVEDPLPVTIIPDPSADPQPVVETKPLHGKKP